MNAVEEVADIFEPDDSRRCNCSACQKRRTKKARAAIAKVFDLLEKTLPPNGHVVGIISDADLRAEWLREKRKEALGDE